MKIAFIKKVFCTKEGLKVQQYVNFLRDHESVFSYNFGVPAIVHFPLFEILYIKVLLRHHVLVTIHAVLTPPSRLMSILLPASLLK